MRKEYIDFYFNQENQFIAEIHIKGKRIRVHNKENLKKLIEICREFGYKINDEGYIDQDVTKIVEKYAAYRERKDRKKKALHIMNDIKTDMKVVRDNKSLRNKLIAGTLALALTFGGIAALNSHKNSGNPTTSQGIETVMEDEDEIIDETEVAIEEETDSALELAQMVTEGFHFSYEDRTREENLPNARRYEDLFEKYAHRYGLDKNLLIALAAQESCGDHYGNIGNGPAEGIMQIEKSVHLNSNVQAFNFETNEVDTIYVTEDKLQDLETNIQIGTMILRTCIENNDYNVPLALQTYNFGPGNMQKVLNACGENENIEISKMRENPNNNDWLQYREFLGIGDPQYIEHVFSFLPNHSNLTVLKRNRQPVTVHIINDQQKTQQNIY